MDISQRIKSIVDEIQFQSLVDIGTDHGYIPIWAIKSGKVTKAIACDINKEPLEKARLNILKHNMQEKIHIRLGAGFGAVLPWEGETAVLAGMGGKLICKILDEDKNKVCTFKQLIISPHLDIRCVRKKLYEINFKIVKEKTVKECGKYYTILNCFIGKDDFYTDDEYYLGKIKAIEKDTIYFEYLNHKINEINRIKNKINMHGKNSSINVKLKELNRQICLYEAVIKKWQ